ncbi:MULTISPECIES: hypothetical protein [unclassified Microcoleus]|uniref:hypothetical protein n=1 Tax=unclassified Microcoleus TaxID=2642155 RepID=UPI002FD00580
MKNTKTKEGSSATDFVTDVTDVRKKEEGRRNRKKLCPMPHAQFPIPLSLSPW